MKWKPSRLHSALVACMVLCPGLISTASSYPYGYIPEGAGTEAVKEHYETWKTSNLTSKNTADPASMLRAVNNDGVTISENHAYAMLLAAYLEDTDETLKKLWAYAQSHLSGKGLMSFSISAVDTPLVASSSSGADIDMAIALDRAAIRWPDSDIDWDWTAQLHLRKALKHKVKDLEIVGGSNGYYMNHFATAYMHRFGLRTGITKWAADRDPNNVIAACVKVTGNSLSNYRLPPLFVGNDGFIPTSAETEEFDTASNKYGLQAARFAWRMGQHAIFHEDFRVSFWIRKLFAFFADSVDGKTDVTNISAAYTASDGTPLSTETSPATIGPAGIIAMAAAEWLEDTATAKNMADAAWEYCRDWTGDDAKGMESSLRLVYMLVMSGGFDLADTVKGVYPPTVTQIVTPKTPDIFPENSNVEFSIKASEGAKPIDKIELRVNDSLVGSIDGSAQQTDYQWTWTSVPKGGHETKVRAFDADGRYSSPEHVTFFIGKALDILPYNGSPVTIPGTITALEYDIGGERISYHDHTPGTRKGDGPAFRNEGVDHAPINPDDPSQGYYIGWTNPPREWVNYTIDVEQAGTYDIAITCATVYEQRQIHLELEDFPENIDSWNGEDITGLIDIPPTPTWEAFDQVIVDDVDLTAGAKRLRVFWDSGGVNITKLEIAKDLPVLNRSQTDFSRIRIAQNGGRLKLSGLSPGARIVLSGINGRTVVSTNARETNNFDIANLSQGLFLLRIEEVDGGGLVKKIIRN